MSLVLTSRRSYYLVHVICTVRLWNIPFESCYYSICHLEQPLMVGACLLDGVFCFITLIHWTINSFTPFPSYKDCS